MTTLTHPNLYDTDFYAWTERQVELLRAEEFAEVDWDNLIEEMMAMGAAQRRELTSRLQVLIRHLLKWQYQLSYAAKVGDIPFATNATR